MNKMELIESLASKTDLTKRQAEKAVSGVIELISEELKNGGVVKLVGFGTFAVKDRKERVGRNPRNPSETIKIPACKAPVFTAGKTLKRIVK